MQFRAWCYVKLISNLIDLKSFVFNQVSKICVDKIKLGFEKII
jgi:hypothetical protein